ncbi:MAG: AAA domain-containing protein [Bacteroidales bacterium]
MDQKTIWSKYILAQEKILGNRSRPIGIDDSNKPLIENAKINIAVDQEIFKKLFKSEIEKIFKLKTYNFKQHFILQDLKVTEQISIDQLINLKETAKINYIDFNEHPVIEGEIIPKQDHIKELKKVIGEIPTNDTFNNEGLILLTLDEMKSCSEIDDIYFQETAGAVFQIKPSICYLISAYYKKIDIFQDERYFVNVAGRLHPNIEQVFKDNFSLKLVSHRLFFKIEKCDCFHTIVEQLTKNGIILPTPIDSTFEFSFRYNHDIEGKEEPSDEIRYLDNNEKDFSFGCKVTRLKRLLTKYFPDSEIAFSFTSQYTYDIRLLNEGRERLSMNEDIFWERLYSEIHGEQYQISRSSHTISFDFSEIKELKMKLESLKQFSYLDIHDREDQHRYKFKICFKSGLDEIQGHLNSEMPNLTTKRIANGAKLIFRQFYKSGKKGFVRNNLINQLDELVDNDSFSIKISDTFQEKYLCEENFELKVEQEEERLSKLIREEFFFGDLHDKYLLGTLQKVNYPYLEFSVDDEFIEEVIENINQYGIKAIFPNLKGEKDKIVRLSNTINKLESNKKLPNDNARIFLFDSSKAKKTDDIGYLMNPKSQEWMAFEKKVFSNQLNNSQKQAIYKCLYADELALIQGPPGTGKSTAIAEIVWQHIIRNQKERILLTSETNLAVDNAIDRLKNNIQNIVKPIRFGNDEKLESEGRFYSMLEFENWVKDDTSANENAVSKWISNISERVGSQNNSSISEALIKWKKHLDNPSIATKDLFKETYIQYTNLIGATGSSIGKINSEGKYTSFFHSYLSVFARKNYTPKINWINCNKEEIWFDTVIMDEASKATPPELALPVLYGKKAIIVGDHRQLPPMVDDEEIEDTLIAIGENKLAKTLSRKAFDRSQFQDLFENIDESLKGTFNIQYRMHPAINDVIAQFYLEEGGLNCGLPLEEQYHQTFDSPESRFHGLFFENIISPKTHVLWIDVKTPEIQEGTSRVNFGEIEVINRILKIIKNCSGYNEFQKWLSTQSIEEQQLGIISFYGKQVKYIKRMLRENHDDITTRISTVDRFQGMERNIIIVSMVRSNIIANYKEQKPDKDLYGELGYPIQESMGFAEFPNRLNVALSRARRLLVIVGNKDHFCKKEIYKNVYKSIASSESGGIIEAENLPILESS